MQRPPLRAGRLPRCRRGRRRAWPWPGTACTLPNPKQDDKNTQARESGQSTTRAGEEKVSTKRGSDRGRHGQPRTRRGTSAASRHVGSPSAHVHEKVGVERVGEQRKNLQTEGHRTTPRQARPRWSVCRPAGSARGTCK